MAYQNYASEQDQFEDVIKYCQNLKIGDKIKFKSEKQKYTVQAKSDRYIICTKPFNLKQTVLYTIIDLTRLVRGPNNSVFNPYDYAVQEDIYECLNNLDYHVNGIEVSHRRCVKLDVEVPTNRPFQAN